MEYRGVFDTLVGSSLRHYKFHIYDDNKMLKVFLILKVLIFFSISTIVQTSTPG